MSDFVTFARSTDLYRRLCATFTSPEGNLLELTEEDTVEAQVEFLRWALACAKPTRLIEIGTHKGFFGYLLSLILDSAELHTFDVDPASGTASEILNQNQTHIKCVFHEGDSRLTFPHCQYRAQFAWVDGGHFTDMVLSDLLQCYRLRVPWVAIDDTVYATVREAVDYVCIHTPYEAVSNPFIGNDRRKAMLLRLTEKG